MTHHTPHRFSSSHWRDPSDLDLSDLKRSWLEDAGSLTARLCTLGEFRVELLDEHQIELPADETDFLALPAAAPCLLREVILRVDEVACVFARSLLPLSSLDGSNQALGQMSERSLGSELFRAPLALRRQLEACYLPSEQLPAACRPQQTPCDLLARRSLFIKQQQPLMVGECFLPSLWRRLGG